MTQETAKLMMQALSAGGTIATGFVAKYCVPLLLERRRRQARMQRDVVTQVAMIPEVLAAVQQVGDRVAMVEGRSWSHCQLDPTRLIFEADAAGSWTRINRAMAVKTGRSHDELLGAEWLNMVDPADRQRVRAEWQAAAADGREFEQRCLVTTKFLRRVMMTFHAIPTRRPCTGAVIGFTGHLLVDEAA